MIFRLSHVTSSLVCAVVMLLSSHRSVSQIIGYPHYDFEFVTWGSTPTELEELLGLHWFKNSSNDQLSNLGSQREDIFQRSTSLSYNGEPYFLLFEFRRRDSGLVAVTMSVSSVMDMLDVSEEFQEEVWDRNLSRFGEPSGGKWIPLIGESKEWIVSNVFVKMIRLNLPSSGVLVKYVLQEEDVPGGLPGPEGGP